MEDGGADELTGVETVEGRDAKLWCRADGSPAPEIVWTKDHQLISPPLVLSFKGDDRDSSDYRDDSE